MRLLRLAAAALMTIALAASAPAARAGDIDLSWDACVPTGGTPVAHRLAGAPGPYGFTVNGRNLAGQVRWTQFVFELRSPNGLPDAWRFDAVGCNAGGIQFETSSGSKACPAIGGLPSTSLSYVLDPSGRAATLTVGALYGSSTELVVTKNYLLGRVLLDLSAATTIGSGIGCEGIDAPVCITLVEATVQRAGVAGPESLLPGQPFLTWNDPDGLTACSGRSLQGIRVEEFMTACAAFVPEAQFLELMPPAAGTTLPGELRLRTEDAGGAVLADVDVIPTERVGEPWAPGGSWLVGTGVFEEAAGLSPDRSLAPFLAPEAGRIVLYDARPGGPVLQDLRYGGEAPVAAPVAGQSVVFTPGGYVPGTVPIPRNFAGEGSAAIDCPLPQTSAPFAIRQVAYSCFPGSTAGQFVEVVSLTDSAWAGNLTLEVMDQAGNRLVQRSQLFGSASSGTIVPGKRSWIIASSAFQTATGLMPDQVWSGFVPASRTTFRLYTIQLGTIAEVSVGVAGMAPAPPPGTSVRFLPDSGAVVLFPPDATNASGDPLPVSACFPADTSWAIGQGAVRLSELSTRCEYADEVAQFLELRADGPDQVFDSHLAIEVIAASGFPIATQTGLFGAHPDGTAWPAGQTWLLGRDDFASAAGFPADGSCPRLDPVGGRIRIYDTRMPLRTIDEWIYGPGMPLPAPFPRQSIQRGSDGTVTVMEPVSPTNSLGQSTDSLDCPDPFGSLRLSEVSTRCEDGNEAAQFLELRAEGPGQEFDSHVAIEVFDGSGTRTATRTGLFGANPDGTAWIEGQTWLLASADFEAATGFPADGSSPRLDLAGGRIRLFDTRLPQRTIDEVAYGPGTPLPAPAGGQSIQRGLDGTMTVTSPVSPTRSSGQTTESVGCPCPPAVYNWGGLVRTSYAAIYDSTRFASRIRFNRLQPSISLRCYGSYAGVTLPDRFVVVGGPVGQEVEIIGLFRVDGYGGGGCAPVHGCADGIAALAWSSPDSSGMHGPWQIAHHQILVTVRVRIGEPFPFSWRLDAHTDSNGSYPGEANFTATFEWANLPPGTHMESCMGYFDDTPVATLPTLLQSAAEPDRVTLQWSAPDDAASVDIERRTEDSEWLRLTTVPSSPREPIAFEDRGVVPGGRYAYRIAWRNARGDFERSAETWVDVPGAMFAARLLDGTLARAPFDLALTLPSREAVSAELFDLRGRRLAARAWTPDAAGTATLRLDPGRALAPGVYWIRVVQGAGRATLRAVVVASSR